MKPVVYLLCLLTLALNSMAQSRQLDYQPYFDKILLAEEQIALKNLPGALTIYSRLFAQYSFVFPKDAFNACQVAVLCKNKALTDTMLFRCGSSGMPESIINSNKLIINAYTGSRARLCQLFDDGERVYYSRINRVLRKEFQKRYRLEQQNKSQPLYNSICADNFNRILELAKANQFPGEQLIGVNDDLENGMISATLKHYPYASLCCSPIGPMHYGKAKYTRASSCISMVSAKAEQACCTPVAFLWTPFTTKSAIIWLSGGHQQIQLL